MVKPDEFVHLKMAQVKNISSEQKNGEESGDEFNFSIYFQYFHHLKMEEAAGM